MKSSLGLVVLGLAACNSSSPHEVPDAPSSPYSLSLGATTIAAKHLEHRAITITGMPGDALVVAIDRSTAGTLSASAVTIDANGAGSVTLIPCDASTAGCLGPVTVTLALASDPSTPLVTVPIMMAVGDVGEVDPCLMGTGNTLYLHGDDFVFSGMFTSSAMATWQVVPTPDQLELRVDDAGSVVHGTFTRVGQAEPLVPGIYSDAQRAPYVDVGHPGLEITRDSNGCNQLAGRFQVHDYTADPSTGALSSVTISFEQVCDGMPVMLQGCFRYTATPSGPTSPPAPDPAKITVQAQSPANDGAYDPNAIAIFYDHTGAVVLDTTVDAFGRAAATLPSGGEVTVIQHANGYEYLHTYRGLVTGDFVVVNPATVGGRQDQMLATATLPAGATGIGFETACGSAGWAPGIGPGGAFLSFSDACRTPTLSVLAVASFEAAPPVFAWQTGVAHVPYGNIHMTSTWTPMGMATVSLSNVPAGTPSSRVAWATTIDARPFETDSVGISAPVDQTVTLRYAPGAGTLTLATVDTFTSILGSESRTVAQTGAPSSLDVDFATQPVPLVSAITQTATGATWTETAGAGDVRTVFWRAIANNQRAMWTIVEPVGATATLTLPSLPAGHVADDPTHDVNASLYGTAVRYVDYDVLTAFQLAPPAGAYRSHTSNAQTYNMMFAF